MRSSRSWRGRAWRLGLGSAAIAATVLLACSADEGDDDDDGTGGTFTVTGTSAGTPSGTTTGTGAGTSSGTGTGAGGGCGHYGEAEPARLAGTTAAHNALRCSLTPESGGPLPMLAWSATVASFAQSWADQLAAGGCNLQHSSGPYGENIFWGSASYQPTDVVAAWASEQSCFSYGTFPDCCSCTCGHYTQLVWRATTAVGCGVADCSGGGEIWVCDYDPPGNYLGQTPY